MSRRHAAKKREVLPDPQYKDELLARFINVIMRDGEKSKAETIVYGALDIVVSKASRDAIEFFHEVLDKLRPAVEVRSRRVGGATYQVPVEVSQRRGIALAMRWLKEYANKRSERTMAERLAAEMMDVLAGRGGAAKKREETHKMADANKAFAHYRW